MTGVSRFVLLVAVLALGGCSQEAVVSVALCDGPTEVHYDPLSGNLAIYPDDLLTLLSPESPTGLELRLEVGVDVVIDVRLNEFESLFDQATGLSGFSVSADLLIDVSGELDPDSLPRVTDTAADASVLVFELHADEVVPVPLLVESLPSELEGEGITLRLTPVHGLKPATTYAMVVTSRLLDIDGQCLAPSPVMGELLLGTASGERLRRAAANVSVAVERLRAAGVITSVADLSAAVTFTTLDSAARSFGVAAAIREGVAPNWQPLGGCVDHGSYRACEGEFDWYDYRAPAAAPHGRAVEGRLGGTLPASVFLPPATTPGPYPLMIFGHGMSSNRGQARGHAATWATRGWATAAIDAPKHGDHPDQAETPGVLAVLELIGVSLDLDPVLDGFALRDNFIQAAYDKLQLLAVLRAHRDLDGDGLADLAPDRLAYYGVSLGGVMGPPFIELSGEVDLTVLQVTGGELTSLVSHSPITELIRVDQLRYARPADALRLFAIMQALGDAGDPAAFGAALRESRPWVPPPSHHLHQIAVEDEIFGQRSCLALVQHLDLPVLGDALLSAEGLTRLPLPARGEAERPVRGVFFFDVVPDGSELVPAGHNNTPGSAPARAQLLHFLDTFAAGEPEIIDTYRTLGIKP